MNDRIDCFEWYLPLAYKDSVAQCRFEQGDVIYRHKPLGKTWGEQKVDIDFLIQVKSPTRTITSTKGDLDVFSSNWNTEIVFEKFYPNNLSSNKVIKTTQGAFYSFLWKNDEKFLIDDNFSPLISTIRPKDINYELINSKIPFGSSGFAIIVDTVSDLIISKRTTINNVLNENFQVHTNLFSCKEAIVLDSNSICPTISVELFIINSQDIVKIMEELKKVLFKGKKDKFRIQMHGLLITK